MEVEGQIESFLHLLRILYRQIDGATDERETLQFREEVRRELLTRYIDFSATAWWWFRKIQHDAEFPVPLEATDRTELQRLGDEYYSRLIETTKALDSRRDGFLKQSLRPGGEFYFTLLRREEAALSALGEERRAILGRMAHLFESTPRSQWLLW